MDFLTLIEENLLAVLGITVAGVSLPAVIIFLFKSYLLGKNKSDDSEAKEKKLDLAIQLLLLLSENISIMNDNVNLSPGEKNKIKDINSRHHAIQSIINQEFQKLKPHVEVIEQAAIAVVKTAKAKKAVSDHDKTFIR